MGVLPRPGGLPASSDRRPDEVSAGVAALGPELDDMVGGIDDVGVVLGRRGVSRCRRSGGRWWARRR